MNCRSNESLTYFLEKERNRLPSLFIFLWNIIIIMPIYISLKRKRLSDISPFDLHDSCKNKGS
jgi:hypothetical protein